jgi:hypothetical protein
MLPMWVLDRFNAMNILVYILLPIGLYASMMIFIKLTQKYEIFRTNYFQYLFLGGVIGVLVLFLAPNTYSTLRSTAGENAHYYNFMENTYANFKDIMKDDDMVIADQGDSYFLASILPIDVLAVEEGHMTPTADATSRVSCQAHLLKSFTYKDLQETKAKYVVIAKYNPDFKIQKSLIETKSYLSLVTVDANFYVYKFTAKNENDTESVYPECSRYKQIEAN